MRQLGKFACAVMREGPKRFAISAADARGAIDQLAHRSRNGPGEDQTDDDGRQYDGKRCQNELAAFLIEVVENVARRSRCVNDTRYPTFDDHRHCRKYVNADPAAD